MAAFERYFYLEYRQHTGGGFLDLEGFAIRHDLPVLVIVSWGLLRRPHRGWHRCSGLCGWFVPYRAAPHKVFGRDGSGNTSNRNITPQTRKWFVLDFVSWCRLLGSAQYCNRNGGWSRL